MPEPTITLWPFANVFAGPVQHLAQHERGLGRASDLLQHWIIEDVALRNWRKQCLDLRADLITGSASIPIRNLRGHGARAPARRGLPTGYHVD